MQRIALAIEVRAQLTVSHACMDRNCVRLRLQHNHVVHRLQEQEVMCAVCYVVEAVARSQYLQFALFLDVTLHLFKELAEYKRSVLYSRLPAQFFSLIFDAQASRGEITGLASSAAKRLIKVLLFMAIA